MLGYTGTFNGKPVSVQSTGMGCPSAAIVIEELHMLGVKRILGIGTCGGLQPDLKLGDLIVAVSAVPQDATAVHYLAGESHTPTADWGSCTAPFTRRRARQARARRSDRLERHLLRPRQGAGPALVRPRHPRRRDGSRRALHARGAARLQGGLPPHGQRRRGRRRVRAHLGRGDEGGRRPDDRGSRSARSPPGANIFLVSGLGRLHQAGLARDRPPRGRSGSGGRDALQRGPGRDRPRRRARGGWERSAWWSSAGTEP